MKMNGDTLVLPPPYKLRKNMRGEGSIRITPALLEDLYMELRNRKVVKNIQKPGIEKTSAIGYQQDYVEASVKSSNKSRNKDAVLKKDYISQRKILKPQRRSAKQSLYDEQESNIPYCPAVPSVVFLEGIPSVAEEVVTEQNIENDSICQICDTSDINQINFTQSFESIEIDESIFQLKSNIDRFLEDLPKENLDSVEDEITKIKNMASFLQEIVTSTIIVAAKLLDKNHLMDTGRKQITEDIITTGMFTKRMMGLTSALNRLETHLITSIECLQQSILTKKFLPEAENQTNFMESFIQLDSQSASENYRQFLLTANSQVLFTKRLHQLFKDNTQM